VHTGPGVLSAVISSEQMLVRRNSWMVIRTRRRRLQLKTLGFTRSRTIMRQRRTTL